MNSTTVANSMGTLNVGGVDTATLVVTGDQNLTITDALDTDVQLLVLVTSPGADTTLSATATTLTSGSGADNIAIGSATDSVTTGAGADTINVATANLTSATTIAGGAGADSISMTNDATVVDADYTGTASRPLRRRLISTSLPLSALAEASGLPCDLTDTGAADLYVGAGFTNALTVNLSEDSTAGDTVAATAYTGALTVAGSVTDLDDNASTITVVQERLTR